MAVRHHLAAVAPAHVPDGETTVPEAPRPDSLVQSYRQLADVFHHILSEPVYAGTTYANRYDLVEAKKPRSRKRRQNWVTIRRRN